MSTPFTERPWFFEGQYLGAEDLQALLGYCREQLQRHQLGSHTWGIVAGLDLVYPEQPDGSVQAFLTPGVAVDGFARMVVVPAAQAVDPALFTGQPAGEVPLWLRYDEAPAGGVRAGFETCGRSDAYQRVLEGYALGAGEKGVAQRQSPVWVGDTSFTDARDALGDPLPGKPVALDGSVAMQAFPGAGDPSRWWIPLGTVLWTGAALGAPTADSRKGSRVRRRLAGWSGEALLGANGLLRLRPRLASGDADTLEALAQPLPADLVYAKADKDQQAPVPREPVWLEADVRARGHVRHYGSRTEWVEAAGTDYLAGGKVTALRRQAQGSAKGLELQVLLGPAAGAAGPTRLAIGASSVQGDDPVQLEFDFTPGAVVQGDGKVGIGVTDAPLALPLTVRADGPDSGLLAFHKQNGGPLAWQVNLGTGEKGLNVTQADPKASNLYLKATGEVGIGTATPEAKLDIRSVSSPNPSEFAQNKWFQVGNGISEDQGRVWLQYGPALAPLLVLSDFDDPSRIQFQQTGAGSEAKPERASWIGLARGASADVAVVATAVGVNTTEPKRPLHVEGGEIHSGGGAAGLSFSNRGSPWSDVPAGTGDRWVLYALGGTARLWSGGDLLGVTPAGFLGVGTTAPSARIDALGSIRLGGGATRYYAVGGLDDARLIAGRCAPGSMSGNGWTAVSGSTGKYSVTFTGAFSQPPVVTVTPEAQPGDQEDNLPTLESVTAAGFTVAFMDVVPPNEGSFQATSFHFMAYGPRG